MNRADRWAGLIFLLLGVAVFVEARKLDYGGAYGAGSGFFPLWLGIATAFFSAILIFQTFKNSETAQVSSVERAEWKKKALAYVSFLFFTLAIGALGFITGFAALVAFLLLVIEREPWQKAILTALAAGAGFYLFFVRLLQVELPLGPLGF